MTARSPDGGRIIPFPCRAPEPRAVPLRTTTPRVAMLEHLVRELLHGHARCRIAELSGNPDRIAHAKADMSARALAAEAMMRAFPDEPGAA